MYTFAWRGWECVCGGGGGVGVEGWYLLISVAEIRYIHDLVILFLSFSDKNLSCWWGKRAVYVTCPETFCFGDWGSRSQKNFWSHAVARNFFRACRGLDACSPPKKKKIWNDSVQDWLKSHFWALATFTDSLILSSNKISIWNSF